MTLIALVFVVSSSGAPTTCGPTDLACTAAASTREATGTKDPADRALALMTAARARLGLFRESGDGAQLCEARRLVRRLARLHVAELGDAPERTRAEIAVELKRLGLNCAPKQPSAPTSHAPHPTPPAADPPTPIVPDEPLPIAPPPPAPSGASASPNSSGPIEPIAASPVEDGLLDVGSRHIESVRPVAPRELKTPAAIPAIRDSIASRPGRGFLIAGGLSLASASLLGGLTGYAAVRVDRAMSKHNGLADTATGQGYTPPDVDMTRRGIEADAPHWRRVMLGTSIATGLVTGAAIALITVGAVKRRRSPERLAIHPILPGLLLTARF